MRGNWGGGGRGGLLIALVQIGKQEGNQTNAHFYFIANDKLNLKGKEVLAHNFM